MAVGVLLRLPALVAWGASLLLGVGLGRALTQWRIAKVRRAGFEMRWCEPVRRLRIARGQHTEITAEIINHDRRTVRCSKLRVISDNNLKLTLVPQRVEIPPGHSVVLSLRVEGKRVGQHGIHGLCLDLSSGPELFSVPLTFANPFGIEVLPRTYRRRARSAVGGRNRRESPHGHPRRHHGESGEFSEIRDHQPGDPFRRIAWRASARRGKLLVRDYELQEHEVVWLLLDASVELWAGPPGSAPLDLAIDELGSIADRHLSMGDSVGLVIAGARPLAWLEPQSGVMALGKVLEALAFRAHTQDADRSGLDEQETGAWVLEHMRSLDPSVSGNTGRAALGRVATEAASLTRKAPFSPTVQASTEREQALRQYLAAFGIASPARLQQDRSNTDQVLSEALEKIVRARPRATRVYLCSPSPDRSSLSVLQQALQRARRNHIQLTWVRSPYEAALDSLAVTQEGQQAKLDVLEAVTEAVKLRMQVIERYGDGALHHLGVKLYRPTTQGRLHRPRHGVVDE